MIVGGDSFGAGDDLIAGLGEESTINEIGVLTEDKIPKWREELRMRTD